MMMQANRWAFGTLSLLTVGWLALQLVIGVTGMEAVKTWPVTSFKMFSGTSGADFDYIVEGQVDGDESVTLDAGVLGLTELQLDGYLRRQVAERDGELRRGASHHLAGLASLWSRELSMTVRELVVRVEVREAGTRRVSQVREVARWQAS